MIESVVDRAERVARWRATLYYMMAALLILTELLGLEDVERPGGLVLWLVMAALFALNLTPFGGWLRPGRVTALLNDEATQEHRRNSFATGFWAALASAAIVSIVATFQPLSGVVVARVIITAALVAALISFGVQERRAAA